MTHLLVITILYAVMATMMGIYCCIKAFSYMRRHTIFIKYALSYEIVYSILGGIVAGVFLPITLIYFLDLWQDTEPLNPFKVDEERFKPEGDMWF